MCFMRRIMRCWEIFVFRCTAQRGIVLRVTVLIDFCDELNGALTSCIISFLWRDFKIFSRKRVKLHQLVMSVDGFYMRTFDRNFHEFWLWIVRHMLKASLRESIWGMLNFLSSKMYYFGNSCDNVRQLLRKLFRYERRGAWFVFLGGRKGFSDVKEKRKSAKGLSHVAGA